MYLFRDVSVKVKREIRCALLRIYGVNYYKSSFVAAKVGLAYPCFLENINEYCFAALFSLFKRLVLSQARIKRRINALVLRMKLNGSYQGRRHAMCLPVRGQRTRTNAQTQRMKRYSLQPATTTISKKDMVIRKRKKYAVK